MQIEKIIWRADKVRHFCIMGGGIGFGYSLGLVITGKDSGEILVGFITVLVTMLVIVCLFKSERYDLELTDSEILGPEAGFTLGRNRVSIPYTDISEEFLPVLSHSFDLLLSFKKLTIQSNSGKKIVLNPTFHNLRQLKDFIEILKVRLKAT